MNTESNVSQESAPSGVDQLKALIARLPGRLAAISSAAASSKPGPDSWSAKEELGHLIDSAANNHQRIVRARLEDNLSLPDYDGDRWVELHGYRNRDWTELVSHWRTANAHLLAAAESVPLPAWSHTLTVGGSEPMTLGFVLDDYVTHMSHHLRHIGVDVDDILANPHPATIYPEKPAQSEYPINELMRRRWSPRVFEEGRAVEKEKLLTMLEAARWAPSCFNDQPRNFVVFDITDQAALERARECLSPGNAWARQAPVLMISVARETFDYNGEPNRWGQHGD